ncbi:redoxin domain-containing protein [Utexia brackfieldae]|uniref:redoxin domain-containing protein n=1 Tax=Utexia brackfieldae TaxID=3074108 RepID=UPI00370D2BCE
MLKTGTQAPEFTLQSNLNKPISLSQFASQKVILVFYPADWSSVCSDELSIFNASLKLFAKNNATVVAISVDSVSSHIVFAEKHHLNFPLLADFEPKGEVSRRYESYHTTEGHSKRSLYLIDETGTIRWSALSADGINPGVDGVIDALEQLNKE